MWVCVCVCNKGIYYLFATFISCSCRCIAKGSPTHVFAINCTCTTINWAVMGLNNVLKFKCAYGHDLWFLSAAPTRPHVNNSIHRNILHYILYGWKSNPDEHRRTKALKWIKDRHFLLFSLAAINYYSERTITHNISMQ